MSKESQRSFNRRQMVMHMKLRKLGFVPVVWQRKDGQVWIEEQYPGSLPFAVDTSHGDTILASVRTVETAIKEAIKSNIEAEGRFEVERVAAAKKKRAP